MPTKQLKRFQKHLGDFLREASVLLFVFGLILDKDHTHTWGFGLVMGYAIVITFVLGSLCERTAKDE